MCDRRSQCAARDAAKQHVGEWLLVLDATDAGDVQYIMDELKREGIDLDNVGEVMLFALRTTALFIAARTTFTLDGEGGQ